MRAVAYKNRAARHQPRAEKACGDIATPIEGCLCR
jgi:hypothetical protein